ncbi:AAA family ATPase [Paraconexibacter antarcticus]|uniref:AAA family ATPase n=1 Tax=Paraconexibacter antarcticus TaxID=2949664 RepID=A0ABY5DWR8_9ACTN|nr:ArsA-related P-loop ATPase [Paraconexibacter antarcticus]UTI66468.1 AAA family ATPase [Paraconexibacter antarcticus]
MIPAEVFSKRLVFVTGKGGVGKTTVAAALATAAAGRGLRTIVAEVAAREDAARRLAGDHGEGRVVRVFEEREVAPGLHHITVDPEHAMQEYLIDQLPVKALADALVSSRVFSYLAAATPGMRELLTVGKLWELAQDERRTPGAHPYDLVVVDAPATGHGLALLAAPSTFADAARVGPIARQGRTIDEMLSDPSRTGVIAVTTAEETPVSETLLLRDGLRAQAGLDLDAILVNQLLPGPLRTADAEALAGALAGDGRDAAGDGAAVAVASRRRAALHATRAQHERARRQRAQLQRLRRGIDGELPVLTLPATPDGTVAALAERLAGR